MSKLLLHHAPPFTAVNLRTTISVLLFKSPPQVLSIPRRFISPNTCHQLLLLHHRSFSSKAFDTRNEDASSTSLDNSSKIEAEDEIHEKFTGYDDDKYPSGEFEFKEYGLWDSFLVKCKMLFALPWQRVKKGSVLTMKLRGEITDQLKSRFSSGLSLPQLCENFVKAAYDPRISGIYLHIDQLSCGWAKVEEIRRHILDYRKSGKFIVAYAPICGEKEYYIGCACEELYFPPSSYFSLNGLAVQASFLGGVLEKVGVEPQVERIGKYKSAGDQLTRKNLSEENREMLTALLDNVYGNWVDMVSNVKGKTKEDIENFINEGVYKVERLKDDGWITDIKYDDEIRSMLKERLNLPADKSLPTVDYKKYSKVRRGTVGLTGSKDRVAIIRASGSITRVRGPFSVGGSGIVADEIIEKIRSATESKKYKAVVLRIDSPGGDALASDLMWREIKLLAKSKPVVASMADVAASGGYYMAMAAGTIVAEKLTLTGSIGVVTGKFNLGKLYEKVGFNKEVISRGRFAELSAAEQRPFRPDEAELFKKSAQNSYSQFRDKAAFSRSMPIDKMEEVAQGRVWTGNDAASRGLVDAIGGISRAIAIAKQKADIPQDTQVSIIELSKPSTSLAGLLTGVGNTIVGADSMLKQLMDDMAFSSSIQARMDGIMFEKMDGSPFSNPIFTLIREYLRSL